MKTITEDEIRGHFIDGTYIEGPPVGTQPNPAYKTPAQYIEQLEQEIVELKKRFTKLDKPRYSGAPMLDVVLGTPNPEFRAWVESLPATYWARYDLSAARIGWEAAKAGK